MMLMTFGAALGAFLYYSLFSHIPFSLTLVLTFGVICGGFVATYLKSVIDKLKVSPLKFFMLMVYLTFSGAVASIILAVVGAKYLAVWFAMLTLGAVTIATFERLVNRHQ